MAHEARNIFLEIIIIYVLASLVFGIAQGVRDAWQNHRKNL